jgi:hypothetical protein
MAVPLYRRIFPDNKELQAISLVDGSVIDSFAVSLCDNVR